MVNIVVTDVQKPQDIQTVAALAAQIWTQHYTSIIGAQQVAYMLAHFQSANAVTAQIASGYHYSVAYVESQAAQQVSAFASASNCATSAAFATPAGYCATLYDEKQCCLFLSKLYVVDDYKRNGIASTLIRHHIQALGDRAAERIWLTVNKMNKTAIAAYRRMGFVVTDNMVTDIGEGYVMDDYKMEKTLK